jgi:ubiquinone/menaquinone biosynthesis C-methylase UbiE
VAFPPLTFLQTNGQQLDFADASFDVVVLFTVISSIPEPDRAIRAAREIARVLAPSGVLLWYDVRYPKPWERHIRAMTKRRIRQLFPEFRMELRPETFFPPLAHRLGFTTKLIYPLLSRIRVLRTHYLGILTRA